MHLCLLIATSHRYLQHWSYVSMEALFVYFWHETSLAASTFDRQQSFFGFLQYVSVKMDNYRHYYHYSYSHALLQELRGPHAVVNLIRQIRILLHLAAHVHRQIRFHLQEPLVGLLVQIDFQAARANYLIDKFRRNHFDFGDRNELVHLRSALVSSLRILFTLSPILRYLNSSVVTEWNRAAPPFHELWRLALNNTI